MWNTLEMRSRKILLNYAEGRFLNSQKLNTESGLKNGFNVAYQMAKNNIDKNFFDNNKAILEVAKGAGYWLWKPYFLNLLVKDLNSDDILFYSDSGSIFIKHLNPLFKKLHEDSRGVLVFELAGKHKEENYTRKEVFEYFNEKEVNITSKPQRMASFIGVRGTHYAKFILNEFINASLNFELITDPEDKPENTLDSFISHRHDQSIWSVLTKKYGLQTTPDPTQWGLTHGESNIEDNFINHTRNPN